MGSVVAAFLTLACFLVEDWNQVKMKGGGPCGPGTATVEQAAATVSPVSPECV